MSKQNFNTHISNVVILMLDCMEFTSYIADNNKKYWYVYHISKVTNQNKQDTHSGIAGHKKHESEIDIQCLMYIKYE